MPVHQVWVLNRHDHNRMVLPALFSHPPANLPTPSPRLTVLGIALCSPQAEVEQRCSMEDLERFACEIIERVDAMLVPRMLSPAATAGSASTLTVQVQIVPGNVAVRERKWGGDLRLFLRFRSHPLPGSQHYRISKTNVLAQAPGVNMRDWSSALHSAHAPAIHGDPVEFQISLRIV